MPVQKTPLELLQGTATAQQLQPTVGGGALQPAAGLQRPINVSRPVITPTSTSQASAPVAVASASPVPVFNPADFRSTDPAIQARIREMQSLAEATSSNVNVPQHRPVVTDRTSSSLSDVTSSIDLATDFEGLDLQPRTEKEIRDEQLQRAQAAIDATEAIYQQELSRLQQEGTAREAQTRNIQVAAGLAGSPFQQTATTQAQQFTTQQLQARQAERQAQVAQIRAAAEERATEIYDQEITRYQTERGLIAEEQDRQIAAQKARQTAAKERITNLAAGGFSLDEMPKQDYQDLLAESGLSDFEAKAIWAANSPQANAQYSIQSGQLVGYYFDPATGNPVVTTTALPEDLTEDAEVKTITDANGNVYWYDAKNPTNEDGTLRTFVVGERAAPEEIEAPEIQKFGEDDYRQWNEVTGEWDRVDTVSEEDKAVANAYTQTIYDRLDQTVDGLIAKLENGELTTGRAADFQAALPAWAQSRKYVDSQTALEAIRAGVGFSELNEMRQASKTGGALGQVAVRELELLQSAFGSLELRQTPKQLKKTFQNIKDSVKRWKDAVGIETIQESTGVDVSDEEIEALKQLHPEWSDEYIRQQLGFNSDLSTSLNGSARQIAEAIKQVESGGNYQARGGSGEFGAYQFMPATWKGWAKQYLGDTNAPMTPENQDAVALAKIQDLLNQGHSPREVALIWNGGQPIEKKGTNKFGVKYDSGAYADKVLNALG